MTLDIQLFRRIIGDRYLARQVFRQVAEIHRYLGKQVKTWRQLDCFDWVVENQYYNVLLDKIAIDRVDRCLEYTTYSMELMCRTVKDYHVFKRIFDALDRPELFYVEACLDSAVTGGVLDIVKMLYDRLLVDRHGDLLPRAIDNDCNDVVTYLVAKGHKCDIKNSSMFTDCSIDMIHRFLVDPSPLTKKETTNRRLLRLRHMIYKDAVKGACNYGNVERGLWLQAHLEEFIPGANMRQFLDNCASLVYRRGNYQFFQLYREWHQDMDWNTSMALWQDQFEGVRRSKRTGNVMDSEMLNWFLANTPDHCANTVRCCMNQSIFDGDMDRVVSLAGRVDMALSNQPMSDAILYGKLDVVRYCYERLKMPCTITPDLRIYSKPIELMEYLVSHQSTGFKLTSTNLEHVNKVADIRWMAMLDRGNAAKDSVSYIIYALVNCCLDGFVEIYINASPANKDNSTILDTAVKLGLLDHVKWMVARGVNTSDYRLLTVAIQNQQLEVLEYYVRQLKFPLLPSHYLAAVHTDFATRNMKFLYQLAPSTFVQRMNETTLVKKTYQDIRLSLFIYLTEQFPELYEDFCETFKRRDRQPLDSMEGYQLNKMKLAS
eukprot:gene12350-14482_t